jgi:thiol-disulfide isomerase/thioredoxin
MRTALFAIVAILAAVAGFYIGDHWDGGSEETTGFSKYDLARVGDHRPPLSHGTINGGTDNIENYDGKVVLLNFWATWCAPCREEVPMLQSLQKKYGSKGFQVVGIAMDDIENVRKFVAELGVEYPNMVGASDVMLSVVEYGNSSGTLPYSVLLDRDGIIRWRHHGEINRGTFTSRLEKLL